MPHPAKDDATSEDISHISGNASDDIKRILGNPGRFYRHFQPSNTPPIFGDSIQTRMVVTEISINNKAEEPRKVEGRVVLELDVADGMLRYCNRAMSLNLPFNLFLDMLNGGGNIHGGCSAFLIDV